jgi:hypothetical protein
MESNSILLDALGGLFNGKIYLNPTSTSKELNFDKYTNISLSFATISPNLNIKETENLNEESEELLSKIPKEDLNECKEISITPKKETTSIFFIILKTLSGKLFQIKTSEDETIKTIKVKYYFISKTPISQQRIIYKGKELENSKKLSDYEIKSNESLHIVLKQLLTQYNIINEYHIPNNFLDPKYDYDFTNIKDGKKKFMRGGLEYKRPCGWKRYALKVNGKYENDNWIIHKGKNINDNEWAVSYHGVKIENGNSILDFGMKISNKYNYSIGIYCTPDIEIAKEFSPIFTNPFSKKKYKIVFQNRVKPSSIHKASEIGGPDYFWYVSDGKDIRPYSICVLEVS